jgi:predicted O-methyltransferase YrrM
MSSKNLSLSPQLYQYLQSISLREAPLLAELRTETAMLPMAGMQIAPEQGQFMALLVQLMRATQVLEIGVFTGYSALAVALALSPQGQMVACDLDEVHTAIARRYWQRAGVADKIDLRLGPALATLDQLIQEDRGESFDFVFIDADKRNYAAYYERSLQLLCPGGLILVDNVLWSGRVADMIVQDKRTQAIREFNQKLHGDDRIDLSVLPIADGLTLARKR